MVATRQKIRRSLWSEKERAAWRAPERILPDEWAEKHVVLTTKMGVTSPGPYDSELTPWVRGIYDAFTDKRVEGIVWVKPAQVGGTLTVQIMICFTIDVNPQNILDFMDTADNAKDGSVNRIQKIIDGIPRLKEKVDEGRKRNKLNIGFVGGNLILAGANTVSQVGSKSAPIVFRDETSKWKEKLGAEAGALELAGERVEGQYYFKLIDLSTPVMEGDPILKQYAISDKRKYYVPCPYCGAYQVLIWKQVKWERDAETNRSVSPEEARKNTWYECESCKKKITEGHKRWMNSRGKWVAEGQVIKQGQRGKGAKGQSEERGGGLAKEDTEWRVKLLQGAIKQYHIEGKPVNEGPIRGFHINRLYSPFRTWGQLAEKWLKIGADLSKRQIFYNAALALPWRVKTIKVDQEKLANHIWKEMGPGVIPPGYDYITLGADVQLKSIYYEVWAWNDEGNSHLVEYGEIGPLREMGAVMSSTYEVEGKGEEGARMGVGAGFIDSRYRTLEVEKFCSLYPKKLFPCKGITTPGQPRGGAVSTQFVKRSATGRKLHRYYWREYASVHTGTFKEELMMRLEIEWEGNRDQAPPPEGYVSFHNQTKSDFFKQLTAEERQEKINIRGQMEHVWVVKSKMNHYLDGRVYAAAAFSFYRDEWARAKARRPRRRRKPTETGGERRRERGFLEDLPEL